MHPAKHKAITWKTSHITIYDESQDTAHNIMHIIFSAHQALVHQLLNTGETSDDIIDNWTFEQRENTKMVPKFLVFKLSSPFHSFWC